MQSSAHQPVSRSGDPGDSGDPGGRGLVLDASLTAFFIVLFIVFARESRIRYDGFLRESVEYLDSKSELYKAKQFNSSLQTGYDLVDTKSSDVLLQGERSERIGSSGNNIDEKLLGGSLHSSLSNELVRNVDDEDSVLSNPVLAGFYAQLGVYDSKEMAQKAISRLESIPIFARYRFFVGYQELSGRGGYLLQLGPFRTKKDAVAFCEGLQLSSVECVLI